MPLRLSALLLAAIAALIAPLSTIQLLRVRNGRVTLVRFPLREDPWRHPRLKLLREREKLDAVVAPGKTQFEKIVLLRRWTRRQWEASPKPFYYPAWDAVEILDLARRRGNRAFCAQYAIVFLQACRALGLHARYVDLEHFVVAVWSDEHQRWVLMDPTNDLHYERGGAPLSDWYLAHLAQTGDVAGLEAVSSDGSRKAATPAELEPFRSVSVCLMNDQLTRPAVVIENGRKRALPVQSDYRRYPVVGRERVGFENFCLAFREDGGAPPDRPASSDADDFNERLDQTMILRAGLNPAAGLVKLKLVSESSPELAGFVGGPDGQDVELTSQVAWDLKPGINVFRARVKTEAGWLGPESRLVVFYKPSWLGRLGYRLASLR